MRLQPLSCARGDSGTARRVQLTASSAGDCAEGSGPQGQRGGGARQSRQKLPCVPTCVLEDIT